jgi:hypothetical protein
MSSDAFWFVMVALTVIAGITAGMWFISQEPDDDYIVDTGNCSVTEECTMAGKVMICEEVARCDVYRILPDNTTVLECSRCHKTL